MNIGAKLLLVTLASVIPAITIVGALNYFLAAQEIASETLIKLDAIATVQENRVNDALDRNFERLDAVASLSQLRDSLKILNDSGDQLEKDRILRFLNNAKVSVNDVQDILIIDSNGLVSISTNQNYVGANYANEKIFIQGQKQKHLTIILNNNQKGDMYVSGPLKIGNEFLGVLVLILNLNTIDSITNDYSGLGESGESFMAMKNENNDAIFISPLRFDANAQFIRTIPPYRTDVPITQALLTNEARYIDKVDYLGKPVLSVTRYIDRTDWGLVVKINTDEAFRSINNIRDLSITIGLTVGVLGTMVSLFFADSLSKPIEKLRDVTAEISKGNFSTQIDISGNDEISKLAFDIKQMESNLASARTELIKSERLSAMGELSARMAHDLRNPLSVLKGAVQLVKPKIVKNTDPKTIARFVIIDRAIAKMTHQLNDVMDFVKTKPLEMKNYLFSEILNESISRISVPENVKILKPKRDVEITCDANRLEMVFVNLLSNAIDAMGNTGTIVVRCTEHKEKVEIEFEDSGPGVPDNDLEKVFEPLYTTKELGTGLGLSSCKAIVEQHGGAIAIRNNPSIFTISLPKTTL